MNASPEPSDPVPTADGSFTFWHPEYREHYHSREGAASEACVKFIRPSGLAERLQQGSLRLLDIGFGLGGNAFSALRAAREQEAHRLEIHSLENDPKALERASRAASDAESRDWIHTLKEEGTLAFPFGSLTLHRSDFRTAASLFAGQVFDLFFHDPFSPMKNPQGWSVELFRSFRRLAAPGACLLTYSEASAVRSGLQLAGWTVGETTAEAGQRAATIASVDPERIPRPLASLSGVKSIPYRDPAFTGDAAAILRRRQEEVQAWQNNPPS